MVGDETDVRLARMRRAMAKMRREGRQKEFDALAAAYADLKRQQMEQAEEEHKAQVRARRAAERAQEVREAPWRWRLPAGFASPLAAQRAREGWRPREEPVAPAGGHLSPWRRGPLMSERVWRP